LSVGTQTTVKNTTEAEDNLAKANFLIS
jgi:hypothetical protein